MLLGAAALQGGGTAGAQAVCPNADSGPEAGAAALADAVSCLVANERAAAGRPALTPNAELRAGAEAHARDMVARRFFSTRTPEGRTARDRAIAAGYDLGAGASEISEVLSFGTGAEGTPRAVVQRWMANAADRDLLLSARARDFGAGVAEGVPQASSDRGATYVLDLASPPPPPEAGRRATVEVVSGVVLIQPPGRASSAAAGPRARAAAFRRLDGAQSIPIGSQVDTTKGVVRLTSARNLRGATQTADFFDGLFQLRQVRTAAPVTELRLLQPLRSCARSGRARGAQKRTERRRKATRRRLWGRGKGRFRTRGRYATATVRGTRWLTEDSCAGTLVRVLEGRVAVRDLRSRRTRTVRAGGRLLVRRTRALR
ncbi:MAG TPA: CAP domain-containing protein [Baekduia sp.]|nr:CAP domain-containing protein [Baekduia sp.]